MQKNGIITVLMISNLLMFTNGKADITVSTEVPALTSFTSRGRVFQDGLVFEPNITINQQIKNTTIFVNDWENLSDDRNYGKIANETDLTLGGITPANKDISINYGIIEYLYKGQPIENTREVYLGITTSYLGINPNVMAYYDVEQANGCYGVFGINHCFTLNKDNCLVVDSSLGIADANYNDFYFGVSKVQVDDWSSGLTYSYTIRKAVVSTGIRYSYLINNEIRENAEKMYDGGNMLIGKVSFVYNF